MLFSLRLGKIGGDAGVANVENGPLRLKGVEAEGGVAVLLMAALDDATGLAAWLLVAVLSAEVRFVAVLFGVGFCVPVVLVRVVWSAVAGRGVPTP